MLLKYARSRVFAHIISRSKKRASRAHSSMQMPWTGSMISSTSRFFVRRKTSIVKAALSSSAAYVTPKRIGGRVTPTKSGSAVTPALRGSTADAPYTPNRVRIQATICGAPKIAAMPISAPMTQPQEIRPTAAAMASAMTISTATGVAIVRAKVTSEFAPVSNGDACAKAAPGVRSAAAEARRTLKRRWLPDAGDGFRGPAPTSFQPFFRSSVRLSHATVFTSIHQAVCQRAMSHGKSWDLQPGLENGERLCTAYEIFCEWEPSADMEFDQAALLARGRPVQRTSSCSDASTARAPC